MVATTPASWKKNGDQFWFSCFMQMMLSFLCVNCVRKGREVLLQQMGQNKTKTDRETERETDGQTYRQRPLSINIKHFHCFPRKVKEIIGRREGRGDQRGRVWEKKRVMGR